jgi:hypothetical protein
LIILLPLLVNEESPLSIVPIDLLSQNMNLSNVLNGQIAKPLQSVETKAVLLSSEFAREIVSAFLLVLLLEKPLILSDEKIDLYLFERT